MTMGLILLTPSTHAPYRDASLEHVLSPGCVGPQKDSALSMPRSMNRYSVRLSTYLTRRNTSNNKMASSEKQLLEKVMITH
jgi:hypothetical protein